MVSYFTKDSRLTPLFIFFSSLLINRIHTGDVSSVCSITQLGILAKSWGAFVSNKRCQGNENLREETFCLLKCSDKKLSMKYPFLVCQWGFWYSVSGSKLEGDEDSELLCKEWECNEEWVRKRYLINTDQRIVKGDELRVQCKSNQEIFYLVCKEEEVWLDMEVTDFTCKRNCDFKELTDLGYVQYINTEKRIYQHEQSDTIRCSDPETLLTSERDLLYDFKAQCNNGTWEITQSGVKVSKHTCQSIEKMHFCALKDIEEHLMMTGTEETAYPESEVFVQFRCFNNVRIRMKCLKEGWRILKHLHDNELTVVNITSIKEVCRISCKAENLGKALTGRNMEVIHGDCDLECTVRCNKKNEAIQIKKNPKLFKEVTLFCYERDWKTIGRSPQKSLKCKSEPETGCKDEFPPDFEAQSIIHGGFKEFETVDAICKINRRKFRMICLKGAWVSREVFSMEETTDFCGGDECEDVLDASKVLMLCYERGDDFCVV